MHSLHQRLTLGLVGVFFLVVVAGAGVLYLVLRAALLAQFDAGLRVKAMVVITATEQKRGKLDVSFSDRFLREFDDELATDYFQVWSDSGKSVERSASLGKRDLPRRFGSMERPEYWNMELSKARRPGRAIGIRFRPRIDRNDRETRNNPIDAVVVVAAQREDLDGRLRRLGVVLLGAGLGMLVATLVTVPLVLGPGLRPIRRFADRARAIDATTLGQRFPTADLPAELRPISERLNDLLARLEDSFERERRFSADLAHELLTPLAELRAIAESALKWPETAGPDDYRRAIGILLRMESLVTQVLDLARAEHGRLLTQVAPVELAGLVREVVGSHEAAADARGLEFVLEGPETLEVETDAGVVRVIVGNLVSNAVAYAPAESAVRISWSAKAAAFEIAVANAAPEIQADDLPHLFERFWRKDPSRTDTQHRGLGLSLAAELASVVGGSLTAEKSPEGDLIFNLGLPSGTHSSPAS